MVKSNGIMTAGNMNRILHYNNSLKNPKISCNEQKNRQINTIIIHTIAELFKILII